MVLIVAAPVAPESHSPIHEDASPVMHSVHRRPHVRQQRRVASAVFLWCVLLLLGVTPGTCSDSVNYGQSWDAYSYLYDVENCEDAVVEVTMLAVECNSPYTFYYGNGANRHSPVCDFGDKATVTVTFEVHGDLSDDVHIYMTMGALVQLPDGSEQVLASVAPDDVCSNYVGFACTTTGSYRFVTKLKFTDYSSSSNATISSSSSSYATYSASTGSPVAKFRPQFQLAFSTEANGGYNLGAVNMDCENNWGGMNPVYAEWRSQQQSRNPHQTFAAKYSMLLATCLVLSMFALFMYTRADHREDAEAAGDDAVASGFEGHYTLQNGSSGESSRHIDDHRHESSPQLKQKSSGAEDSLLPRVGLEVD
jgi:hypothetical protein